MPGRHFIMPATHDVRVEANAYRVRPAELVAKLLKDGNIINIDIDAEVLSLFYFCEVNTVGCKQDALRLEPGFQSQSYLVDADAIQPGSQALDVFEDIDIGKRLAGIEESCLATREG